MSETRFSEPTDNDGASAAGSGRGASGPWRPLAELELLISGAVIFTLFRIPSWLQSVFFQVDSKLGDDIFLFPFLLFYLANLLSLALIVAFSVHFLLRSFWVAIAGLNQVFPSGIDWGRLDMSPISRRVLRGSLAPTAVLEKRLDRGASTIFSILFFLTLQVFFLFVVVGALLAVLVPLKRWLAPSLATPRFMIFVFLIVVSPLLVSSLIDRWFKQSPARLDARPRLARWVELALRLHHRVFFSGLYLPIQLTFASHTSNRATSLASGAATVLMVGLFVVSFLVGTGLVGFDSFTHFPESAGALAMDPSHYENLGAGEPHAPTLDRDVVDGPYLRLFIPYHPRRDGRRVGEQCAELEPLRDGGFFLRRRLQKMELEPGREAMFLSCLASLYRLELNGEPARPEFSFYRHPETGVKGLRAYLPTADLPIGRNVLMVYRAPSRRELERAEDEEERRWLARRGRFFLPFWK